MGALLGQALDRRLQLQSWAQVRERLGGRPALRNDELLFVLLGRLAKQVGDSRVIRISCALLMRVDFVAAGDLLNWVAMRHAEGREIVFHETHRLVALMFGAMGINETARVQLRHL